MSNHERSTSRRAHYSLAAWRRVIAAAAMEVSGSGVLVGEAEGAGEVAEFGAVEACWVLGLRSQVAVDL